MGIRLSALGMGNMRLPIIGGDDSKIDVKASEEIIGYCMSHGINYYDTGRKASVLLPAVSSA